jgi:alkylation response protein AidB-like acyl-CoA dehydrogenase
MGIAIHQTQRELEGMVDEFLADRDAAGVARSVVDSGQATALPFWDEIAKLGWLGLHISERNGGAGLGLTGLAIVAERLGRQVVPGLFVPTAIVAAAIEATAPETTAQLLLPALMDGTRTAAIGWDDSLTSSGERSERINGVVPAVIGAADADLLALIAGKDLFLVGRDAPGVEITIARSADISRPCARVRLSDVSGERVVAAGATARYIARTVYAAEASGGASASAAQAVEYALVRRQFGRTIASFQAVKHHCANMHIAAELSTAAVWDAARSASADEFALASAAAATLATRAFLDNAQLNIQVHGGVGFTWEHNAHLFLRRALTLAAVIGGDANATQIIDSTRAGVRLSSSVALPEEAEGLRATIRSEIDEILALPEESRRSEVIERGFAMPHWPAPYGRAAGPIEQLLIDEEFGRAKLARPSYGITGWVILTLIQHGTDEQVARWVAPALTQDEVWCQLFSEPDAGSDAAAIRCRAIRVDGGWKVNGQKVWTSGAQDAAFGLATVRTGPNEPKRDGITVVVIDMAADGVDIRPLRQITGDSHFNEVFLNGVFVPDGHVIGAVDDGWTVARSTFGNERVSIGSGAGGATGSRTNVVALQDEAPDRGRTILPEIGRYLATNLALRSINLRRIERAVAGAGFGAEGNMTKLVLAEQGQALALIATHLLGPEACYLEGPGAAAARKTLSSRGMSIAGGTSEIARNQIAERVLGMPRDPLVD